MWVNEIEESWPHTHTYILSLDTFLKVCVLKSIFSPLESILDLKQVLPTIAVVNTVVQ